MSDIKILIVGDEFIVAADPENKIKKIEYEIAVIASRWEAALEMALRFRPKLISMDIQLEGIMNGIKSAEAIGNQYTVPIVTLTAHSDRAALSRVKLTGR